jgi:hypothetical protein
MTSKIKVDNINKVSDDTNIIKKCGTTTTIGSGASNPIVVDGSAVTLGRCGGTVALASGATQTGFGRTGTVDWQTSSIKTATFTAVSGEGYFCNTSGGAFTVNLPAGSAGAIVSVVDYTNTFQTNALTIAPNGSEKIGGVNANVTLSTEGQSVTLVYVDGTEGWKNTMDSTSNVTGNPNLVASVSGSGNTLATAPDCANVKIATFTGPGSFTVSNAAQCAANNVVSYLIVGGGGSSGSCGGNGSGGGGAGGFREVKSPVTPYTASPLDGYPTAPNRVTVTAQAYAIVVLGGGAGYPGSRSAGSNSSFGGIISAGGGAGASNSTRANIDGGSGGGGRMDAGPFAGGSGNTPPVSPSQGNNGGTGQPQPSAGRGGGGGGAGAVGANICGTAAGAGGNGVASSITSSSVTRAGGGGGAAENGPTGPGGAGGSGGSGGGGNGVNDAGCNGGTNLGGGGGADRGSGGSGIVIIRYKFQ